MAVSKDEKRAAGKVVKTAAMTEDLTVALKVLNRVESKVELKVV